MDTSKAKALASEQGKPRSLRLRLMLWYGALLAIALGCFAVLVLVMATSAMSQSVDNAVRAEARIATLAVQRKLSTSGPYWPPHLLLPTIDTYRDPGAAVEILDAQGSDTLLLGQWHRNEYPCECCYHPSCAHRSATHLVHHHDRE